MRSSSSRFLRSSSEIARTASGSTLRHSGSDERAIAANELPRRMTPNQVIETIAADDPALVDGRGPGAVAEVEVEFDGTLHLWTESELALSLHVDDAFAIYTERKEKQSQLQGQAT